MRYIANNTHASIFKTKNKHHERGHHDNNNRSGAGDDIGHPCPKPKIAQQWFKTGAHPEQKPGRQNANRKGYEICGAQIFNQRSDQRNKCMTIGVDTQDVFELACRYQNTGGGNEPCDHRMRQKIR